MAQGDGLTRVYTLVPTAKRTPRPSTLHLGAAAGAALPTVLDRLVATGQPIHLDLETMGLDATDPDAWVVGLGLANAAGTWYFDCRTWGPGDRAWHLLRLAVQRVGWVAFNVPFDGAWLWRAWGGAANWVPPTYCTHVAFRLLTAEGWTGQRWSLAVACRDILGWPDSHKDVVAEALVKHGLTTTRGTADKGQLWRLAYLDPEVLGHYCALDADASWQLGQEFGPVLEQFPDLAQLVRREWVTHLSLLIEQQHAGMYVDTTALHARYLELQARLTELDAQLRAHPQLAPLIAAKEAALAGALYAPHVTHRRVRATLAECLDLNAKAQAAGQEFLGGLTWPAGGYAWHFALSTSKSLAVAQRDVGGYWYREVEVRTPRNQDKPYPRVNWASDAWLREVLYTLYPATQLPPNERGQVQFQVESAVGPVVVDATDGGLLPVNLDVMVAYGEVGKLLTERSETEKEASYVTSYLEGVRGATYHPRLKAPGTITGRLSGDGGINLQQIPKTAGTMGAFQAPEGWSLIDLDFTALEPKVMAYFSQDPGYLELYASGKPHDVYLYVAQALFPDLQAKMAEVYAPGGAVTAESVKATKRAFKLERDITKPIHLASAYGAGAGKMYSQIKLSGIMPSITLEDVHVMRKRYQALFAGIRSWRDALTQEWTDRGGWVYNGSGRPLAMAQAKVHDCVNTFCLGQGTLVRVKDRGWVAIQDVAPGAQVWTGQRWARTAGPVFNGRRAAQSSMGLVATPDHQFLGTRGTWNGWWAICEGTTEPQRTPARQLRYSWADVWCLGGTLGRVGAARLQALCTSGLSTLSCWGMAQIRKLGSVYHWLR